MELHKLPKLQIKKSKRTGRGHGSGRGKTAGRGTKGQKAKRKIYSFFEGGGVPLIKRLPFLRGRGRNKVFKSSPITVQIKDLNKISGVVVDIETLIKSSMVSKDAGRRGVKILGNSPIEKTLTVKVPVSAGARRQIEKAGGRIEI